MKTEILTVCDQLVAALANGVYQGIALTIVVAMALRLLARTNAATRHSIWLVTLLLLPGLIVAHYWLDNRGLASIRLRSTPPETISSAELPYAPAVTLARSTPNSPDGLERVQAGGSDATGFRAAGEKWPEMQSTPSVPPAPWRVFNTAGVSEKAQAASVGLPSSTVAVTTRAGWTKLRDQVTRIQAGLASAFRRYAQPIYWDIKSRLHFPRLAGPVVLVAWLCVVFMKLLQVAWRLYEIIQLKRRSSPATEELNQLFETLQQTLGLHRRVSLRVSNAHRSPVVLGFFHPVVLLPPGDMLPGDPGQTMQVLRHELAHVARWDDWANLFQHFIEATLFFHPGVWWISRQLSLDREIACDDQVLHGGGRPKAYALILADLASRMKRRSPMLAPGASTNKSQLQQRISMILDTNRNTSPRLAKTRMGFVTASAALLAMLAICSGPRFVLAQTATASAPEPSPKPEAGATGIASSGPASAASAGASLEVVQADPSGVPAPPDADSGPRYKPDVSGGTPGPETAIVTRPVPPRAPVAAVPPAPLGLPGAFAAPNGGADSIGPGAAGLTIPAAGGDDGSIEKRLERLERMVHSLMGQQGGLPPGHPFEKGQQWNWNMDQKQFKEMIDRQTARAQQEAKRAAEEFKRAQKEMDKAMKQNGDLLRGPNKEAAERQLDSLRRERENLERQMEKLDSEIEKLEQKQEKLQEDQERRSELQEENAKEQAAVAETEVN